MTAEELKSKIVIHSERGDIPFTTKVTGSICFNCSIIVQNQADRFEPRIMNEVKAHIREAILRTIYDDQRKALYEPLNELLMTCIPNSFSDSAKLHATSERLMKAARYQEGEVLKP